MFTVFTDFDGVTHPVNCKTDQLFSCAPMLWRILAECPDVQLVISSSWREQHSMEEMIDFLTFGGGEELRNRVVGKTPRTPRARSTYVAGPQPVRHNECEQWLIENGQQHRGWLALDDEALIFPKDSTTLYLINGKTGLTDTDADAIIKRITSKAVSAFKNDDPLVMFSRGLLTKNQAIELCGLRDYAELLVAMGDADLPLPSLPKEEIETQVALFAQIWKQS